MPTYAYRCCICGAEEDHFFFHPDDATPKRLCVAPKGDGLCSGLMLRQIGAGGGVLFRGDGFYETTHRSASFKEGEKKDVDKTS